MKLRRWEWGWTVTSSLLLQLLLLGWGRQAWERWARGCVLSCSCIPCPAPSFLGVEENSHRPAAAASPSWRSSSMASFWNQLQRQPPDCHVLACQTAAPFVDSSGKHSCRTSQEPLSSSFDHYISTKSPVLDASLLEIGQLWVLPLYLEW